MNTNVVWFLLLLLSFTPSLALDWVQLTDDPDPGSVRCLVADPYHDRILRGSNRGYRIYLNDFNEWIVREYPYGTGFTILTFATDPDDSMSFFTGGSSAVFSGYIFDHYGLSLDGVVVWGQYDCTVYGMCRDLIETNRLFAAAGLILRSTDSGQNWDHIHFQWSDRASAVACAPNGDVYVGYGPWGNPYDDHGIIRSMDGGDSWRDASGDMPLPARISAIFIDPGDSQHVFVRQGGYYEPSDPLLGIYETFDGGVHWVQVFFGNVVDLAMHPLDPATLACITEDGVWLSTDGGVSWTNVTGNLPGYLGNNECAISNGGRLFASTNTGNIWAAWIDPTAADETPVPVKPTLSVYPNPFNPRTEIHFSLSEAGPVHVEIYDTQGRRVRLLATGPMETGEQVLAWNGCDDRGTRLSSGIYLLRVQTRAQEAGAKLVFLK